MVWNWYIGKHDILVRYQGMYLDETSSKRREMLLEEFLADCFAHLSDNKNYFGRTNLFDRIRSWVRGKLRNWGMNVKVSDLELRDLFRRSMEVVTPEGSWKSGPYKASGNRNNRRWSVDDSNDPLGEFNDAMSRIDQPEKKPYTSRAVESIKEVIDESDSNGLGLEHDRNDNIAYDENGKPKIGKVLKTKNIAVNGRTDSEDSLELAYGQAGENVQLLENLCSAVERETGYKKHMRNETHFKEDVKAKLKELGLSEIEGIRAAKAGRIQDKELEAKLLEKDERDIGHKWKGHPRANQKRQFDYENDAARVVDLIGGTITIPQTGSYKEAIDSIKRNLPSGASVDKVKRFNMKPTDKGYQDMKVSVRFPNGGIGEIIIAEDIMVNAKEERGGHACYEIRRQLKDTEAYLTDKEVSDCVDYLVDLECAIYDRAGFDAEEFAKLKAMASDSVARLLGKDALTSGVDIKSVKSLSSKLHLCRPYSSSFQATPVTSEIKYDISETSGNVNNSDLSSTSSITENEKNRHSQTEEDEMAQILDYLNNLGSQLNVAEDVLQKARKTGDKKKIEEAEAALARTKAARKGSEIMASEMDQLYSDLVRAAEGGDEDARARAERMADRQLESRGYNRELYHGTRRADCVGNEFRKDRAQTGPMAFFTPSEELADNYRDMKSDTSLTDSGNYDELFYTVIDGQQIPLSDKSLWNRLSYRGRNLIRQRAAHVTFDDDYENIIYDETKKAGTGGFLQNLREARGNAIEALRKEWLESGNLWDREEDFLEVLDKAGVAEAFRNEGWEKLAWDDPYYKVL